MALGKGDNIWKNTMTKDCYERDNLNGTLHTNMKDPTTGLKVYQNDITDIYLEHYKQERLSNRLVYRYNKVTQYIYDNPIRSLVSGAAVGFGINALVDIALGKFSIRRVQVKEVILKLYLL